MADVIILAELATETTAGEEDRTAPPPASQAVLLTPMSEVAAHPRKAARFADSLPASQPVVMTIARADLTGGQAFNRPGGSFLQFPF